MKVIFGNGLIVRYIFEKISQITPLGINNLTH